MNYRLKWSQQEEHLLRTFGGSSKKNKWTLIAKMINDKLPAFHKTPKQCRQRYNNNLMFSENNNDLSWTVQQETKLFQQFVQKGSKWKLLCQSFPTKSQNTIKNKFYGNIRKVVRKLNKVGKQKSCKSLKPIRQKSIIRIIQPEIFSSQIPQQVIISMKNLRIKLLDLLCNLKSLQSNNNINSENLCQFNKMDCEQIVSIIKDIHLFNRRSRFYTKKHKVKQALKSSPSQSLSDKSYNQDQSQQIQSQLGPEKIPFDLTNSTPVSKQQASLNNSKMINYSTNYTSNEQQLQDQPHHQFECIKLTKGEVSKKIEGDEMSKKLEKEYDVQKITVKKTFKQNPNRIGNNVFRTMQKCLLDYCQNHERQLLFLFKQSLESDCKANNRYNLISKGQLKN